MFLQYGDSGRSLAKDSIFAKQKCLEDKSKNKYL